LFNSTKAVMLTPALDAMEMLFKQKVARCVVLDLVGVDGKDRRLLLVHIKTSSLRRAGARWVLLDLEDEGARVWEQEDALGASRGSPLAD